MPSIRYSNGKRIRVHCAHCNQLVWGTVRQQRIRWIVKRDCMHGDKQMGYTMPQEELIKKGLVTKDTDKDPRIERQKKLQFENFEWQRREKLEYMRRKGFRV